MRRLRFTRLALADVKRAREIIETNHPDGPAAGMRLADEALTRLWQGAERLCSFPNLGRASVVPGVLELVIPGPTRHLTFTVGYRVEPEQVVVLAITWGGRRFVESGRT